MSLIAPAAEDVELPLALTLKHPLEDGAVVHVDLLHVEQGSPILQVVQPTSLGLPCFNSCEDLLAWFGVSKFGSKHTKDQWKVHATSEALNYFLVHDVQFIGFCDLRYLIVDRGVVLSRTPGGESQAMGGSAPARGKSSIPLRCQSNLAVGRRYKVGTGEFRSFRCGAAAANDTSKYMNTLFRSLARQAVANRVHGSYAPVTVSVQSPLDGFDMYLSRQCGADYNPQAEQLDIRQWEERWQEIDDGYDVEEMDIEDYAEPTTKRHYETIFLCEAEGLEATDFSTLLAYARKWQEWRGQTPKFANTTPSLAVHPAWQVSAWGDLKRWLQRKPWLVDPAAFDSHLDMWEAKHTEGTQTGKWHRPCCKQVRNTSHPR